MATKKEVAVKEDMALATWDDYDIGDDGFDGLDQSELAIPFINLLQSNSRQVEDGDASAGDFYNNVMETLYPGEEGVLIVPCARQRVYVEWIPVDDGGGLVGVHEPDSAYVQDAIRNAEDPKKPRSGPDKQYELVETVYLYCLVADAESWHRAVIGFSSTKLKKYRQFFTKASSQMMVANGSKFRLPLWAHRYRMTSVKDENRKGQRYHNVSIDFADGNAPASRLAPNDPLFNDAKEFFDMVNEGKAKADMKSAQDDRSSSDNDVPI